MRTIVCLFFAIILSSCNIFEDDEIKRPIPVDSISVNNISNLSVDFTASIFCGSMCWKNTYFEKRISGSDVFIKTFAVMDESSVCLAVCVDYQTTINISLISAGSYTFHFWKSDTSSIDTTLMVGL
jgi:hypothetical protein